LNADSVRALAARIGASRIASAARKAQRAATNTVASAARTAARALVVRTARLAGIAAVLGRASVGFGVPAGCGVPAGRGVPASRGVSAGGVSATDRPARVLWRRGSDRTTTCNDECKEERNQEIGAAVIHARHGNPPWWLRLRPLNPVYTVARSTGTPVNRRPYQPNCSR
jgi:hypothetical protein